MQNPKTKERIKKLTASEIATVIGCIILIAIASYMAYEAIDAQALRESLLR